MSNQNDEVIITAATPEAERRYYDLDAFYRPGRNCSIKPGSGEVHLKVSHDRGLTYDISETFTGPVKTGPLPIYGMRVEFECTGNAVVVISG